MHCASGHTRSMTVLMIYLAFYKKHKDWNDLEKLKGVLNKQYPLSFPNMKAVEKVISQNKKFQANQPTMEQQKLIKKQETMIMAQEHEHQMRRAQEENRKSEARAIQEEKQRRFEQEAKMRRAREEEAR